MIADSPPERAFGHGPQVEVKQFGQDQDDLQRKEIDGDYTRATKKKKNQSMCFKMLPVYS